jgi:integrase/recombinase XerD
MKGRRSFSAQVPEVLADALSRYFDTYRPLILATDATQSPVLWIGDKGWPWSAHTLGLRVTELTRSRFGVSISPHLFRDCAVTTMILASPRTAALAGALLGHHTSETSRSHYLQARQIEAGRDLRARIDQIKRVHR